MVRETTLEDKEKDLTAKLLAEAGENVCPNLKSDEFGSYCARDLKGKNISDQRRIICDNYSLQLWCLDVERFEKCIWYNGEPFK